MTVGPSSECANTALTTFGCLLVIYLRPRVGGLALAATAGYLYLSLYPAYLASRVQIRDVIWRQQSYETRVATTVRRALHTRTG